MKMVGAGVGVPSRGKPEPLTTARFEQLQVSIKDAVVRRHSASKMDDLRRQSTPNLCKQLRFPSDTKTGPSVYPKRRCMID